MKTSLPHPIFLPGSKEAGSEASRSNHQLWRLGYCSSRLCHCPAHACPEGQLRECGKLGEALSISRYLSSSFQLLAKAGLTINDIAHWEVNEAFSVVAIAFQVCIEASWA